MKINQNTKKSNKKWLILLLAVLVLAAAGALAYNYLLKARPVTQETRPVNTVDYSPASKADKEDALVTKENTIKEAEKTPPTPAESNVSILISRAGQSSPGLPVAVRTIISGATSGACDMKFSLGGTTFTKTFEIKQEATTYTCNGDVDSNNFNASGDWSLTVSIGQASAQADGVIHVQK